MHKNRQEGIFVFRRKAEHHDMACLLYTSIVIRHPFAGAVLSAPDILYDDRVAALYAPVVLLCAVALTVGGADQDCRYLGGERPGTYCGGVQHMLGDDRAGKIDVRSQQLSLIHI